MVRAAISANMLRAIESYARKHGLMAGDRKANVSAVVRESLSKTLGVE
jgi:hypothetical protein